MFMEEVDRDRYPEAKQKYRFELLQDMELSSAAQTETFEQEEAEAPAPAEEVPAPVVQPAVSSRTVESEEQMHIDPLVMEFLDAGTFEQKLNILAALRHRITDSMINTLAAASDLEIKGGNVEERYDELRSCLQMFAKFECNRLR